VERLWLLNIKYDRIGGICFGVKMVELSKAFEPKSVEKKWYRFWEENGLFKADANSAKEAFCIVIPPPNVTGVLHMGHALVDTLQDILIRFKRMQGYEALWIPGTDHAGIATQTVVERNLIAKTGKRRGDFTREEFLGHVWNWKEKSEKEILNQLREIGCSCDWSRLRFTMDEGCNKAVRIVFKKLFDEGLIYRGDYLVNWDPVTQTALGDDEVEYEDVNSNLWYFRYPVEGGGEIVIATTRPETMLGDTAVAVNGDDERYTKLIGKMVLHPITGRKIPIIADPFIKTDFGSGAVKITPAHDHNDYEMAHRHDLPMINIMTRDGKINENGGSFKGMTMQAARVAVVEELKRLGHLDKIVPHPHRVGTSYRSKAVIEPYLSKQWFVAMTRFKKTLREAVEKEQVKLLPKDWEKTYFHWIDNLRDWCISRQLWWGHQIPIWYRGEEMICYDGPGVPPEVEKNPGEWKQDEDVLDTWFSAALWPLSTLGWPEKTVDFKKFYPTSTLITGHDILFFWVARMIMMGEYLTGEVPFKESFLHGLIYGKSYWRFEDGSVVYLKEQERLDYDLGKTIPPEIHSKWEKMSKTKGNIIDPLEIVDSYGADAMRMALCASATHARQIDLDRRRFEEYKNFANKVWNGARFIFMNIEDLSAEEFAEGIDETLLTLEDRWILSILTKTVKEVTGYLDSYGYNFAADLAYNFYWKEFCSYYLEFVKPDLYGKTTPELRKNKQKLLIVILCSAIRLMHPIAPFITEELFQCLKMHFSDLKEGKEPYVKECAHALSSMACIVAPFPKVIKESDINVKIEEKFLLMSELIYAIRNIRAEMQIPPAFAIELYLSSEGDEKAILEENVNLLSALIKIDKIYLNEEKPRTLFSSNTLVRNIEITIPLPAELKEKERVRLVKEQQKLIEQFTRLQGQLSNEEFIAKAPQELITKLKTSVEQMEKQLAEIATKLEGVSL
jgi:valyl-tRNA synthetase